MPYRLVQKILTSNLRAPLNCALFISQYAKSKSLFFAISENTLTLAKKNIIFNTRFGDQISKQLESLALRRQCL